MEDSTFILGVVPTLLVIAAELLTPVSEDTIRRQVLETARQLVRDAASSRRAPDDAPQMADVGAHVQTPPDKGVVDSNPQPTQENDTRSADAERDAANITSLVAETAVGASKVTLLIPTWINVTASLIAILIDTTIPKLYIAIFTTIWTAFSGLASARYFSILIYHHTSGHVPLPFGMHVSYTKLLSGIIIIANAAIIALTIGIRLLFDASGAPISRESTAMAQSAGVRDTDRIDRLARSIKAAADEAHAALLKSGDAQHTGDQAATAAKEATNGANALRGVVDGVNDRLNALERRIDRPLSKADWKSIQARLASTGIKVRVDGVKGSETCTAVRLYQRQLGSDETGVLTPEQIASLLDQTTTPTRMRIVDDRRCNPGPTSENLLN